MRAARQQAGGRGLLAVLLAVLCPYPGVCGAAACPRPRAAWEQCGGVPDKDAPWPDACCPVGFRCVRQSQWYYQCWQPTAHSAATPPALAAQAAAPPRGAVGAPPAASARPPALATSPSQGRVPSGGSATAVRSWPMPPRSLLYSTPQPLLRASATVLADRPGPAVPPSFLGLSYEWGGVAHAADNEEYLRLLADLSSHDTGPLHLRIGGSSTDQLRTVPEPEVWRGLRRLAAALRAQLLVGLTFRSLDPVLARAQMDEALAQLGSAVEAFEIGNEPNFYSLRPGLNATDYVACCFVGDWTAFTSEVACPSPARPAGAAAAALRNNPACAVQRFAGPVWGHINLWPDTLQWFLSNAERFVSLVTVHWYKHTSEVLNTAASLLDEGPVREEMANLAELVGVAARFGKRVRVAEMNTISNSGREGVSDVMASALWTLDSALEVATAGGVGVNLHQASGQTRYSAVVVTPDPTIRPRVRPSFYGALMLQTALASGARLLGKEVRGPPSLKVFPLQGVAAGDLRVAVINKDPEGAVGVELCVDGGAGAYGEANVTRLVAVGPRPLESRRGITLAGRQYAPQGALLLGSPTFERLPAVQPGRGASGGCYQLYMPPGSAALVRLVPG